LLPHAFLLLVRRTAYQDVGKTTIATRGGDCAAAGGV
jgi:hypothetical protein